MKKHAPVDLKATSLAIEAIDAKNFIDPRLVHLNNFYSRSSLQPPNIDFTENKEAYRHAIDEIIKHNQECNEYNYIIDVRNRIYDKVFPLVHKNADWETVYDRYVSA